MSFAYATLKQHSRRRAKTALLALIVSLSALVPPLLAQGRRESAGKYIDIKILSVAKDDAGAKPAPDGQGRIVPVNIQWQTGPWNGAQLLRLEANLSTGNTDGSTTVVKKPLGVRESSDTLPLPLPQGVFAKTFVLTLTSECSITDANGVTSTGASQTSKRGSFPVPAEKK